MDAYKSELLHNALTDPGIQLKNFGVNDYMKTISLAKKLASFLNERAEDIQKLVEEYNKEFNTVVKSEAYKKAKEKKEGLTDEEEKLLATRPVVDFIPGTNRLVGPSDFIDKVEAINKRDLKLKKEDLNFVKDGKVFKSVVESAAPANQSVLYEFLFKE